MTRKPPGLVVLAPALALLAAHGPGQAVPPRSALAARQTVHVDGPARCNCSGAATTLDLCHVTGFLVEIGGASVWASTGLGTSCSPQPVPPGRCVYYRYSFSCVDRGLVAGWSCHLVDARVTCADVAPASDC